MDDPCAGELGLNLVGREGSAHRMESNAEADAVYRRRGARTPAAADVGRRYW
jgi:hypothetical protein